ncbi:MAG: hypothetical protein ACP5N7_06685 [Candidatus Pacearchaeota archaeon]
MKTAAILTKVKQQANQHSYDIFLAAKHELKSRLNKESSYYCNKIDEYLEHLAKSKDNIEHAMMSESIIYLGNQIHLIETKLDLLEELNPCV